MSASELPTAEMLTAAVLRRPTVTDLAGRMATLRQSDPAFAQAVERQFLIKILALIESKHGAFSRLARNALRVVGWEVPCRRP